MDSYSGDSVASGASVYTEAKQEYTKQLSLFLVPTFHKFFMTLLNQAQTEETNPKRHLWKFQEFLSQVPEWNIDKVQRETSRIVTETHCDYLEELVTAVFIAHTKVLTAIRIGNKNKKVQITIPKLEHFIHRSLSECSRLLWSSAYLFANDTSPVERQKNHRQIEGLLHDGVASAIRGLLPVKNILKDYLAEPEADEEDEDEKDEKEDKEEKDEDKALKNEKEKDNEKSEKEAEPHQTVASETVELPPSSMESVGTDLPLPELADLHTDINSAAEESTDKILDGHATSQTKQNSPQSVVEKMDADKADATAEVPTITVDTEPTVRFTDFDQVFQPGPKGEVKMEYVPAQPPSEEGGAVPEFVDDHLSDISDFEDLEDAADEPISKDDYEVLA